MFNANVGNITGYLFETENFWAKAFILNKACWYAQEAGTFWTVGCGGAPKTCSPSKYGQLASGRYIQQSVIGEGTYGRVYACFDVKTDRVVAIKLFKDTHDAQVVRTAKREAHILSRVHHINIVQLLDFQIAPPEVSLVFEFVNKTVLQDLEAYKKAHKTGLPYDCCRQLLWQLVDAAAYLHSIKVIHRDIKPENLLVSNEGILKLCDFGFARTLCGTPLSNYVATRWYRAPELLVGDPSYGFPVDIWAIGCMAVELHTGNALFEGESDADQLYLIMKLLGRICPRHEDMMRRMHVGIQVPEREECTSLHRRFFADMPEELIEFIQACLTMDPDKRSSCDMLQKMSYFCGVGPHLPAELRPAFYQRGPAGEALSMRKKHGPAQISVNASAVWNQNVAQRHVGSARAKLVGVPRWPAQGPAALDAVVPSPSHPLSMRLPGARPVGVTPLERDLCSETSFGNQAFAILASAAGCPEAPHVPGCLHRPAEDLASGSHVAQPVELNAPGQYPGASWEADLQSLTWQRILDSTSSCTPLLEGCSLRSPEANDIGLAGGLTSTGPPEPELDDDCAWISRRLPQLPAPFPVLTGQCGSCPSPMPQPWKLRASVACQRPEMPCVSPNPTASEAINHKDPTAAALLGSSPSSNTTAMLPNVVQLVYSSAQPAYPPYPHVYGGPSMKAAYCPNIPRTDGRLLDHKWADVVRPVIRTGLPGDPNPKVELRQAEDLRLLLHPLDHRPAKGTVSHKPKPLLQKGKTKGKKRRGADEDEELYQSRARAPPQPAKLRRSQRARRANAPADYLIGEAAFESVLGETSPPREKADGVIGLPYHDDGPEAISWFFP